MFEKLRGKVILLDNNRYYQVIWGTELEGHKILYLLNTDDFSEPLICEKVSDECLEEIKDRGFLQEAILSIAKEINIFAY